jgi:excisionase family DNA binding protein
MHHRLQIGTRENPASNRRHDSRFAVAIIEASSPVDVVTDAQLNQLGSNENHGLSPNAAHHAATRGGNAANAGADTSRGRVPSHAERGQAFEALISTTQAARLLGNLHVKTLQRYARLGRLPGYQIGGHWYFRESELDAWLRLQINSRCQSVR